MNKHEFLAKLKAELSGIPQDDIEERIGFYSEMIDDRIEEGLSEEQAVSELGTLESITAQIMSEIPLTRLVREKVKPSRALRAWEIVLLALGSPIWLSLLIALFAVLVALYAVIGSVIIALWAVELALALCFVSGIISSVFFMARGSIAVGIAMLGAGLLCGGIAIFAWFGCKRLSKAILRLAKGMFIWIKSCFIKMGAEK